uniref:Amidohydrolase 3 domain-containing protein n=1 Tax=Peronospora matthiolae TaxID=2874970 RepID=A0AAV1UP66_9STRA
MFTRRLRNYGMQHPVEAWVAGFGWAQDKLSSDARYPPQHDIDAVIQDRPVLLHHSCWHIAVVNAKASVTAGVDLTTRSQDDRDGAIDVGDDGAVQIVQNHVNEPSLGAQMSKALRSCVRAHLTAIHMNDEGVWRVYINLQEEDGLPVRVYLTPSNHELGKPMVLKAGDCNGLVSCHRMKIFCDGRLGAETAALRDPHKGTSNRGIFMYSDEDLAQKLRKADDAGNRIEIHAIDRAVEQVLAALKTAGVGPDRRPVLLHCQILSKDLISRMREQGVIANIWPSFAVTDAVYVCKRLQGSAIGFSYCLKRLLDSGVVCAEGTDALIETCNPFQGMFDAIYHHNLTTPRVCFYQKSDSHSMKRLPCTRKVVLLLQWQRTHLAKLLPAFVPILSCFAQM